MKKKSTTIGVLILFFVFVCVSIGSAQLKPLQQTADFTMVSTEGDTITLSDQLGKIVVLHFWKNN